MRVGAKTVLGVAALILGGCSESEPSAALASWVVADGPLTAIGEMDGDSAYLFQEIADATFLGDGQIIVADAGLAVLRVFGPDGSFVVQMGREGDGPGEFRSLREIWVLRSDTVLAWDSGSLRLTYFDRRGSVARSVSLRPSTEEAGIGNLDLAAGPLLDGSVALASLAFASSDRRGPDRVSVERFSAQGAHLDRLAEVTGLVRAPLGERASAPIPFSPFAHFATHGNSIYFTDGASPEVTVWSEGSERVINLPPSDHDADAAWTALAQGLEGEGREFYKFHLPHVPRSDSIPHLAGLLVDDAGRVWAKQYEPETDALWLGGGGRTFGGTWWVTDPSGTLVASVAVPPGLAPIEVAGDLMMGITVDAYGVERVQVHRLAR